MILVCIFQLRAVLGVLALAVEPHRSWLSRRIKMHRALMALFFVGYLTMAVALLAGVDAHGELIVAAVFFFGAVFVWIGIAIQSRMSSALLQTIRALVPMCAWCKRVRVESGGADRPEEWQPMEVYLSHETGADITHGICPACADKLTSEAR